MSRSEGNLRTDKPDALYAYDQEMRTRRTKLLEEAAMRYTAEEIAALKKLPKAQKQAVAIDLLFAGMTRSAVERFLGIANGSIASWVEKDLGAIQILMHEGMSKRALLEFPETFNRLADLRFHPNAETARKASLDMARAAGRGIDAPAPASLTVNMNGKQNQFNLTTRELDDEIKKIAASLGPEAEALAKGELSVKPIGFAADSRGAGKTGGDAFEAAAGAAPSRPE